MLREPSSSVLRRIALMVFTLRSDFCTSVIWSPPSVVFSQDSRYARHRGETQSLCQVTVASDAGQRADPCAVIGQTEEVVLTASDAIASLLLVSLHIRFLHIPRMMPLPPSRTGRTPCVLPTNRHMDRAGGNHGARTLHGERFADGRQRDTPQDGCQRQGGLQHGEMVADASSGSAAGNPWATGRQHEERWPSDAGARGWRITALIYDEGLGACPLSDDHADRHLDRQTLHQSAFGVVPSVCLRTY